MNPEAAVIGSVLLTNGKVLDELSLTESEFNDPRLARVFAKMRQMRTKHEVIDPVTISALFPEHAMDVWNWQSETPTAESAEYYSRLVRDDAIRRELIHTGQRVVQESKSEDLDGVIDKARRDLGALSERRTTASVEYVSHLALAHLDTLNQPRVFMKSPWKGLNSAINGFRPGALYVIGARPGVGKTVVGLQVAYELSKLGPVSFHSLEMSKTELLNRLYAMVGSVYLGNIEKGKIDQFDWQKLAAAKDELNGSNLAIVDSGSQTLNDIRASARTLQQNGGLTAIVVDYLGLIHDTIPGRKRYEAISEFSMSLKAMARDFNVPVIALAQLNRMSESRIDKAPALSDLRDSGAIEQDADVVMLLSRYKREQDDAIEQNGFVIDVAKNRHGITGEVHLVFNGGCARIENVS